MAPLCDTPLVSIVTPSYNTGRYIEETLRSVRDQDYPRVEHIVLDSGSTDETPAILSRFPAVTLINPAPAWVCEKINLGLSLARGEVVAWLCADDYYLPHAICKAVDALKRHPEAALVYANDLRVDEHGIEVLRNRSRQTNHHELVHEHNWLTQQTVFIRREALDEVGLLNPRYSLACDWELYIRISARFPIVCIDDWWGACRERPDQLSNLHQYQYAKQGWQLTREHGAGWLSPYLRNYWRSKLLRFGAMMARGDFRAAGSKLRKLVAGLGGMDTQK